VRFQHRASALGELHVLGREHLVQARPIILQFQEVVLVIAVQLAASTRVAVRSRRARVSPRLALGALLPMPPLAPPGEALLTL
jgi:hypothetical protein